MANAEVTPGAIPHWVSATYHAECDMPNVYRCRSCDTWVFQVAEAPLAWLHTDPTLNPPQRRSALWMRSFRVSLRRTRPPKGFFVASAVAGVLVIALVIVGSLTTWGGAGGKGVGGKVATAGAKTRPHVARHTTGAARPAQVSAAAEPPQAGSAVNPASSAATPPASSVPSANTGVGTTVPPGLSGAGTSGSNSALPPQSNPVVTNPQQITAPESPATPPQTTPPPDDSSTTTAPPTGDTSTTTTPPTDDTSTTTTTLTQPPITPPG